MLVVNKVLKVGGQRKVKQACIFILGQLLCLNLLFSALGPLSAHAQSNKIIGEDADSPFGLNVHGATRYLAKDNDFSVPFEAAKAVGSGWTREEFSWSLLEPQPGQWRWDWADAAIEAARQRGLNILGLLDYNIEFSQAGDARTTWTKPELGQWRVYVSNVVNRYKDKIKYWEIWNEPQDSQYFQSATPVEDYGELLGVSYDTIKQIDPQAKVLVAGFVPVGNIIEWMDKLLTVPGGDKFDIVSVHPFVNDADHTTTTDGSVSPEYAYWSSTDLNFALGFAARAGLKSGSPKAVWATEFGWNSDNNTPGHVNKVSKEQQADYLVRSYVMGLASGKIDKFFVYQFHDDNNNAWDSYGLLTQNWLNRKPAYNAYANLVQRLTGTLPLGRVDFYENKPLAKSYLKLEEFEGNGSPANCDNRKVTSGTAGYWNCYVTLPTASTSLNLSTEHTHSGKQALKVNYSFTAGRSDYDSRNITLMPPANWLSKLEFNPTRIGFWAYGDEKAYPAQFTILVKDSQNKEYQYRVGRVGPANLGWQRYEAQLGRTREQGTVKLAYPLSQVQILINTDGLSKNTVFSGTTFIDDVYAESGTPVYAYRYLKTDGNSLDVAWAAGVSQPVEIRVPTLSSQATIYDRDGRTQTIFAKDGFFTLSVSDAPIYLEHRATLDPTSVAALRSEIVKSSYRIVSKFLTYL